MSATATISRQNPDSAVLRRRRGATVATAVLLLAFSMLAAWTAFLPEDGRSHGPIPAGEQLPAMLTGAAILAILALYSLVALRLHALKLDRNELRIRRPLRQDLAFPRAGLNGIEVVHVSRGAIVAGRVAGGVLGAVAAEGSPAVARDRGVPVAIHVWLMGQPRPVRVRTSGFARKDLDAWTEKAKVMGVSVR